MLLSKEELGIIQSKLLAYFSVKSHDQTIMAICFLRINPNDVFDLSTILNRALYTQYIFTTLVLKSSDYSSFKELISHAYLCH